MSVKISKTFIKGRLAELINQRPEEFSEGSSFFNTLGLDSLDLVELLCDIESEYSIHIPDEETDRINCLSYLYKVLENQGHVLID